MMPFDIIYLAGRAGVRKLARPIASVMRKVVNMHPRLQRSIAQIAEKNQKEEKEIIEKAAQRLVVYTMVGSALVYYQTRPNPYQKQIEQMQRQRQQWDELRQLMQQLYKQLPPEQVREQRDAERVQG